MEIKEFSPEPLTKEDEMFQARIAVCGVGGGGNNTVQRLNNMGIRGATLIAMNTDSKHLNGLNQNIHRLLLGGTVTRGLGAGGFADVGNKAAEFSRREMAESLKGYNLVFITAGMGGGTGTGASPVAADIAKENGAIVIGIVTFPFKLERVRLEVAKAGIDELSKHVDTLVVIDNQRLVDLYPNLVIEQAFNLADEITSKAVRGITETVNTPSLINLDFADVKAVMASGGLSMISIGEASGNNRVNDVVRETLKNRLLDVDYESATGILFNITGGDDMTIGEATDIGTRLTSRIPPEAGVVWGARIDPAYNGKVEVIAIFSGVKSPSVMGTGLKKEEPDDFMGIKRL